MREILAVMFPDLSVEIRDRLDHYFQLVLKWNRRISLTTITEPRQFASRHLGEAVFAEKLLLGDLRELWDIGTGVGVPGIPFAILRPGLTIKLVESNRKKAIFLEEVSEELGLDRVTVVNQRFEAIESVPDGICLTARAVEKMTRVVVELIEKGFAARQILIFGGSGIEAGLRSSAENWEVAARRLPDSTDTSIFSLVPRGTMS